MARRLMTLFLIAGILGWVLGCGSGDSRNPTVQNTSGKPPKELPKQLDPPGVGGAPGKAAPKPE